jgi:cysteine desulfurase
MKVYFDNAATTPLHPKVFEKMKPFLIDDFGNASSIHSFGRKARVAIEEAREAAANFLNANTSEIYFTSGATESNNFIISGIAHSEFLESNRNHLITSKADHHSVIDTFDGLSNQGFIIEKLNVNSETQVDEVTLIRSIIPSTSLLSLIHINNETGTVNPIEEISGIVKEKNIFFHIDAVQSFGKTPIDVKQLNVDALAASAHKNHGPKGIGLAFVKSGTPMEPLIFGGSQERNRRAGTENVAAIVGFAEAIKIAKEKMIANENHVQTLKDNFINGLSSIDKNGLRINGRENSSPYILNVTLKSEYYKNDSEAILMYLDINGIAASNGAACSSGTLKPSHVILSAGYSAEDANGTIRFSFSRQNTLEEVDYTLEVLEKMSKKFKR